MKHKILFVVLAICCFTSASFSQNQKIEVNISMEDTNLFGRKDLPVKVKITNKAEDDLDTKTLKLIKFCFFKRLTCSEPGILGDKYIAFTGIPQKLLKKDESFEFEVNLKDLHWKDEILSGRDLDAPKNFATIPIINRILEVVISVYSHSIFLNGMNIPINKSFLSNQIFTTLKP